MILIFSFCDRSKQGNGHQIHFVDQFSAQTIASESSKTMAPHIYVQVQYEPIAQNARLVFFHRGREVNHCGSGTLAAAAALLKTQRINLLQLTQLRLLSQAGEFSVSYSRGWLGLRAAKQPAPVRRAIDRRLWCSLLGATPNRISLMGMGKQYLIAEFDNSQTIKKMQPDMYKLATLTQQALIVTAPTHTRQEGDYVMRYFAPRFGNPEDAATGSANFLLMQYWSRRLLKHSLTGVQLSSAGGLFRGRVSQKYVDLYGQTR